MVKMRPSLIRFVNMDRYSDKDSHKDKTKYLEDFFKKNTKNHIYYYNKYDWIITDSELKIFYDKHSGEEYSKTKVLFSSLDFFGIDIYEILGIIEVIS